VLLHGPDNGLVRERSRILVEAAAGTPPDPFRVSDMSANELRKDPALLMVEAAAVPLTRGTKVIRLRDVTDKDCHTLKAFLATRIVDALIVAEAGELRGKSVLKRLFEEAEDGASIACYQDTAQDIRPLIQDFCQQHHLEVTPRALDYLVQHLGLDRMITRRELEKLVTYMGELRSITEADAMAIVGDSASHSLNSFAVALADGQDRHLARTWTNLRLQGTTPVQALRTTLRHFQRLHYVVTSTALGQPSNTSMERLRPPIHFSVREAFQRQVRIWGADKLSRAMLILTEAETQCKQRGGIGEVVTSMAFLRIINAAKKLAKDSPGRHH
jgi:DNA polymerase-3 subunit delta